MDAARPTPAELTRVEPAASPLQGSWQPPAEDRVGGAGRLSVVLVDDSDDLRMLLRVRLQLTGRIEIVAEASSGREGVEVVARTTPAVVLLDLAMPGGNGIDAIPEIRRVSPHTRIVMLSGFSREHLGQHALEAGADAYVEKDRLDVLLSALADLFPELAE